MSRTYDYLGPAELKPSSETAVSRFAVKEVQSVLDLVREARPEAEADGAVTATFIVDICRVLWIADRRSEHVACALGKPVVAAGEMSFLISGDCAEVVRVTNQSTGYCPEPSSWPAVEEALRRAGLPHPTAYTQEFTFRLCLGCDSKNVVKEDDYRCAVCGAELDRDWNFLRQANFGGSYGWCHR